MMNETEGIRRITPIDFQYAHQLHHTIRLICAARQTPAGLLLSVRPSLIPQSTILASVRGAYNAVWVSGKYGGDTFYYGRGAGAHPTGVAVVSDLMRVAREIRSGSPERVSPFAHARLGEYMPIPVTPSSPPPALPARFVWRIGPGSSPRSHRRWRPKIFPSILFCSFRRRTGAICPSLLRSNRLRSNRFAPQSPACLNLNS